MVLKEQSLLIFLDLACTFCMLHGFKEPTMATSAEGDSLQFLLWEGVMVLKELIFNMHMETSHSVWHHVRENTWLGGR